jgi:uncharacterized protein YdaU (DUF1376 family)
MNGLPYYKAYPRDFIEGTVGLPFEVKAAYRLVLDLIYMQGGRLPDDPGYIAGHLGCSVKKWNALRLALIKAGKLSVFGAHLGNLRADKELETLGKFQDKQRENASGPRKNKDLRKPRRSHTEPEPEREHSVANATDGDAVSESLPTVEVNLISKAVWDAGKPFLASRGIPNAGAMIGRWLKSHPPLALLQAIEAAQRSGTHDPIPYITEALKGAHHGKRPSAAADRISRVAARFEAAERRMAGDTG